MHRCRTMLDKDLINTGIYESAGKQSLPLVQLVQQLLRYLLFSNHFTVHIIYKTKITLVSVSPRGELVYIKIYKLKDFLS